ncbi:hypothetical protein Nepgr_005357 [Nepenthes gracilis]|uniref:Uncharacterized protein n=1 Tax=Nepenthes gracilis TaxID=150966 RepID=A0AAD3S346_NEPGR|nr:hypothetical protein Nepgr_005357 [Nepenthes gracilis]
MFQSDFAKSVVCLNLLPSSAPPSGHIRAQSGVHPISMVPPDCFTHINLDDPCPVEGLIAIGSKSSPSHTGATDCRSLSCCRAVPPLSSSEPPSGLLNLPVVRPAVSTSEPQVGSLSPSAVPEASMGPEVPCQSDCPLELLAVPPPCIDGAESNKPSASCPSDEPAHRLLCASWASVGENSFEPSENIDKVCFVPHNGDDLNLPLSRCDPFPDQLKVEAPDGLDEGGPSKKSTHPSSPHGSDSQNLCLMQSSQLCMEHACTNPDPELSCDLQKRPSSSQGPQLDAALSTLSDALGWMKGLASSVAMDELSVELFVMVSLRKT